MFIVCIYIVEVVSAAGCLLFVVVCLICFVLDLFVLLVVAFAAGCWLGGAPFVVACCALLGWLWLFWVWVLLCFVTCF